MFHSRTEGFSLEICNELSREMHITEMKVCPCECPNYLVTSILRRLFFFFPKKSFALQRTGQRGEKLKMEHFPPSVKEGTC